MYTIYIVYNIKGKSNIILNKCHWKIIPLNLDLYTYTP